MSKVSVAYRLSAKVDPSDRDSAWHSAEVSFEEEVDGTSIIPKDVALSLMDDCKAQVFTQLGLEYRTENGVLVPVFPISDIPKAKSRSVDLPTVTLNDKVYVDYRGSESQKRNSRFPDFKEKGGTKGYWLLGKDGQPTEFAKELEAAGLL